MEHDKDGNERFRPGTEIRTKWSGYTTHKKNAISAATEYNTRKGEIPAHPKIIGSGPDAALGIDNKYRLGGNYTAKELLCFRENDERKTFNETYGTVWDKRALQTGKDSRKAHDDGAWHKAPD
ncbi:hypothetical protein C8A05DRAFT_32692 [Staphylotrichum tortipilum]|uniref:Uncharacterized protein n=1 Tax=Staphylotrichum tortipilum TaxID=2831512 RepID=A0AAN6MP77_9PEZI|nr:hypothetical protein C8A05DRAFT_32692 [Staphylotrichum longicolle]